MICPISITFFPMIQLGLQTVMKTYSKISQAVKFWLWLPQTVPSLVLLNKGRAGSFALLEHLLEAS